jgi:cell wall-associated NlpC family hydrolase
MDLGHPELWQPGDRIYFSGGGEYIDHTGIYIGNYQFIHASGRHQMVHIDNILDPRYWHILRGVRRGFS